MSEEELGEVKIIITSGFPKIIVTTYKDGYPVEVDIEKIKGLHYEDENVVFVAKMTIRSSASTTKEVKE